MVIEKSFKRATLIHQIAGIDDISLEITPHPTISGCCMFTVLKSQDVDQVTILSQIVVNNSEIKIVAELLSKE